MNHCKLLSLLVIGLLFVGLAATVAAENKDGDKKRNTVEGTILKVDPSGNLITVRLKEKMKKQTPMKRDFPLREATKFIFLTVEGEQEVSRKEAYKHKQFKEGARVTVITDGTGKVLEVRVGTARKDEEKK